MSILMIERKNFRNVKYYTSAKHSNNYILHSCPALMLKFKENIIII